MHIVEFRDTWLYKTLIIKDGIENDSKQSIYTTSLKVKENCRRIRNNVKVYEILSSKLKQP